MISGFSVLIVYFASFIIFFYNLMLCLVPKTFDNKNQNQKQNEMRNIRKEKGWGKFMKFFSFLVVHGNFQGKKVKLYFPYFFPKENGE